MNLKFLYSFFFLFAAFSTYAQVNGNGGDNREVFEYTKKGFSETYDFTQLNRAKVYNSTHSQFEGGSDFIPQNCFFDNDIEPFASIDIGSWGEIQNLDTGGLSFYSMERVGNILSVNVYDNDIEVVDGFSVEIPESTNGINLMNFYSTSFFSNDGKGEFMVYLHYFEDDIPGPQNQVWDTWIVNSDGEIIESFEATATFAKKNGGNKYFFTYFHDEDKAIIKSYNPVDFEVVATYEIDDDLLNYFQGPSFNFMDIDGKEHIVVAHYKHLFMDNWTMEITPDNNLVVKLLDFDLEETKVMMLDIETRHPDEFYIPMATFGNFYRDQRYDISKDIFNTDDKLEIVYGIYYYNMMMDTEWTEYIMANEDGEILHELNIPVLDTFTGLTEIEGHDNQIGLLFGDEGMATNLGFFDIESWTMVAVFDARHNGDLLSTSFNRVPHEDTYHWIIGLGEPDMVDGIMYGVVNEYNIDKTNFERRRFLLSEDAIHFQAVLTRYTLEPDTFVNDGEVYYSYVVRERDGNNKIFNNLYIVKNTGEIFIEFRGDTEKGNLVGTTFLTDGNGNYDKLAVSYMVDFNNTLTEFYRLPMETILSTFSEQEVQFAWYPNPTRGQVSIQANLTVNEITIHNITGRRVANFKVNQSVDSFDLSSLAAGIYIATIEMENGVTKQVKFIKN